VQAAFAVIAVAEVKLIALLNQEIATLGQVVVEHFGRYRTLTFAPANPGFGAPHTADVLILSFPEQAQLPDLQRGEGL